MSLFELHLGDCLEVMRGMADNSVDAVVTDPPYGLSFMGKHWDHGVPGEAFWREVLRVAKPGAHLLAFGGTRTYHRLACAIEDAGWEIRDCVMWVYGSGFPKSADVSKAIDKANGRRFEDRYALGRHIRERREASGFTRAQVNAWFGYADGCEHWERQDRHGARVPTLADWRILRDRLGLSDEWSELVERAEAEREVLASRKGSEFVFAPGAGRGAGPTELAITAPATDAARQWSGWGTALKPAWEPIIVARKPLAGTVAENVLKHGTGAINVDGCRIGNGDDRISGGTSGGSDGAVGEWGYSSGFERPSGGRWPANVIHDGSDEVVGLFPQQRNGGANVSPRRKAGAIANIMSGTGLSEPTNGAYAGDSGSAARFFYCAKASKRDRDEGCEGLKKRDNANWAQSMDGDDKRGAAPRSNHHPTVKPTALMRYLCRLVTPPGGVVLDPFMGSGSTGKAAILEGFQFVGIEQEPEYLEIARARIAYVQPESGESCTTQAYAPVKPKRPDTGQLSLFDTP